MKILVTGAAGFIGFHLVNKLILQGHEVVGLDCINDYYEVGLKYSRLEKTGIIANEIDYNVFVQSSSFPAYRFIKLKLEDKDNILTLFEKECFDVVVNLAGQAGVRHSINNPYVYVESNVVGFLNILEGSRHTKVGNFIYASTSSIYGLNSSMPLNTSQSTEHQVSLYAATKKANEMMAHSYSHLYNMPTTGLRFFTVYGPWGRPDMALFLFSKAIVAGEPINVFNNGDMIRDFTYVDDIVESVARLCNKPAQPNLNWDANHPDPSSSSAPYKIYNIGNSQPVKLIDYIDALEAALGKKAIKNMMPMQMGDVLATHADVSDLMNAVNFKPQTDIRDGVKAFADWYLGYYA